MPADAAGDAQIREGETLDGYLTRLDALIVTLEVDGPFDQWVYANLCAEYVRQVTAAEDKLLGDLSKFGARVEFDRTPLGLLGIDYTPFLSAWDRGELGRPS